MTPSWSRGSIAAARSRFASLGVGAEGPRGSSKRQVADGLWAVRRRTHRHDRRIAVCGKDGTDPGKGAARRGGGALVGIPGTVVGWPDTGGRDSRSAGPGGGTRPFPRVAQTQTTPETEPARQIEAAPQTDLDRQRAEAARQAERDAAARAEQQIRRIEEAIFRQAAEEAAARKAASRRGETVGQPDTARARPQEMEPARRPAEAAPTVAPGSAALSTARPDPSRSCRPLRRRR